MCTGLTPEKPQQGTALFGHSAEPLMLSTGVFPRDDAHITGQRLTISETLRIAQEYFGRQCRHRPHSGMGHQPSCSGTISSLLGDLLGEVLDLRFHRL